MIISAENSYGKVSREFLLVIDKLSNKKGFSESEYESENPNFETENNNKISHFTIYNQRNTNDLTNKELEILNDYTVIAVLPEIKVNESRQYDFEIELLKNENVKYFLTTGFKARFFMSKNIAFIFINSNRN